MTTTEQGKQGEEHAANFLKKNGYKILDRNYRCRLGEIDLIAGKNGMVVFVEVKLRKNDRFAGAMEAVNFSKQQKLRKTALLWLAEKQSSAPCRFDVVEVYTESGRIHHIPNAFE